MNIKIDFEKVFDVSKKKENWWNVTPDMISSCVVWSRFDPKNWRTKAIEEVEKVVNSVHTKMFDERLTKLLHTYPTAWKWF